MTMTSLVEARLFVGGRFRAPSQTEPVLEAATGELLGHGSSATESEIDDAVAAARGALNGWSSTPAADRAEVLIRIADALTARAADTNELCTRENGMPIWLSRGANGAFPAALLRYYADLIVASATEEIRPAMIGHTIVRREPVGVVGAITPWNYPQALAAMKIAPALAAGCTMVLKAAPETALDALIFAEAADAAGLPAGVLNIVAGGPVAGAHLVAHPGVDKVAFTGSTAAGRIIAETCGRLMRPVTLELGGKSAAIILDDADLDATMKGLRSASFVNNGQTCHLSSRVLAPRSRYAEVVAALAALADGLTVGDPLDRATHVGPLVSARQRERVLSYIEVGTSEGAKLVAGGSVPADQPRGWFVSPTVFADVDNRARIAQEEIFGPVLAVIPYDSDHDAIDIANDSEFGLGGTVWSTDTARATDVARKVRTGTIGVNDYQLDMAGAVRRGQGQRHGSRARPRRPGGVPEPEVDLPGGPGRPEPRLREVVHVTIDPRTPVLVGYGQVNQRESDPSVEPVDLMEAAARAAADPRVLEAVDSVRIVNLLSWRYRNPGLLLAQRIRAGDADSRYTSIGGNVPQSLVNQACLDIQSGRLDTVLIAGAETWRTRTRVRREGGKLDWTKQDDSVPVPPGADDEFQMAGDVEIHIKLDRPAYVYPMFEQAVRIDAGETPQDHRLRIGELWARFSAVAQRNPHAWSRDPVTAEEIWQPSPDNRMISWPYTKLMNSNNMVDQGAALVLTSAEKATSLQIPRDRWVFPYSGTDAHDTYLIGERAEFHRSPAIRIAGRRALEARGARHRRRRPG